MLRKVDAVFMVMSPRLPGSDARSGARGGVGDEEVGARRRGLDTGRDAAPQGLRVAVALTVFVAWLAAPALVAAPVMAGLTVALAVAALVGGANCRPLKL